MVAKITFKILCINISNNTAAHNMAMASSEVRQVEIGATAYACRVSTGIFICIGNFGQKRMSSMSSGDIFTISSKNEKDVHEGCLFAIMLFLWSRV